MAYDQLASSESIKKTEEALTAKGYDAVTVDNGAAALEKIKSLIPKDASVMNGSSVTLEKIGFIDYLKADKHGWNNLHAGIVAEKDPAKQASLRKQASLSEYYLGSVHAMAENGEFVVASNSGSQLPHIVFTSPNLILVVGVQKIVPTLAEAMKRLEEYVVPLENEHMKSLYGMGTQLNKVVIFKGENAHIGRKVHVILVKEQLGF